MYTRAETAAVGGKLVMKSKKNSAGEWPIMTVVAYAPLSRSSGSFKSAYMSRIDGRFCASGLGSDGGGPNACWYF